MKRTEEISPNEQLPQWSKRKFVDFDCKRGAARGWLCLFFSSGAAGLRKNRSRFCRSKISASDPDNAYFAEGVQDEILTRLAKVADLKVISRTSTQRFKSAPEDLPQIAKQLGVAHILEGSVQKQGDQVRVNVQLIKAATDAHLVGGKF